MLEERICKKREELNKSIETQQDYSITYRISVELDELITEYYRENIRVKSKQETKEKSNKIVIHI